MVIKICICIVAAILSTIMVFTFLTKNEPTSAVARCDNVVFNINMYKTWPFSSPVYRLKNNKQIILGSQCHIMINNG